MAAKGGYTEVVDCLLERDPHVNARDQVGQELYLKERKGKELY